MSTDISTREQTVVFGVLAVQSGKVSAEAWEEAAMTTLANAPSGAVTINVAEQLVAQGTISLHDAATLQGMAAEAIRASQGDVAKAINAVAGAAEVVNTVASSLFEDPHSAATLVQNAGFDPNAKTISIESKKFSDKTISTDSSYEQTFVQFLRKVKIFNKSRYSRNRQLARVIFYFAIYINLLIIYGIFYVIYGLSIYHSSLFLLVFIFNLCYVLSFYLRFKSI